jgi:hypothetical protein
MKVLRLLPLILVVGTIVMADSGRFVHRETGFSVQKPEDWHYLSEKDQKTGLEKMDVVDQDIKRHMLKNFKPNLVTIARYPEPHDGPNPSFAVEVTYPGNPSTDPKDMLTMISGSLSKFFRDVQVLEEPRNTEVDGKPAAWMKISYTLSLEGEKTYRVLSEVWYIIQGKRAFVMATAWRTQDGPEVASELKEMVESVSIAEVKQPSIDDELMSISKEINRHCPMMIDRETRLDTTMALPESTLMYIYTLVNMDREEMDIEKIKKSSYGMIRKYLKSNSSTRIMNEKGVTLRYSYKDKHGFFLFSHEFAPEDYRPEQKKKH